MIHLGTKWVQLLINNEELLNLVQAKRNEWKCWRWNNFNRKSKSLEKISCTSLCKQSSYLFIFSCRLFYSIIFCWHVHYRWRVTLISDRCPYQPFFCMIFSALKLKPNLSFEVWNVECLSLWWWKLSVCKWDANLLNITDFLSSRTDFRNSTNVYLTHI